MIELALLGCGVGILSGFFGIGGGTILVPMLLIMGYDIKTAIGISIVQMVFSSIFGSYLNARRGTLDIPMVFTIGMGGFAGALASSVIVAQSSPLLLETIFLGFVLFALARVYIKTEQGGEVRQVHPAILFGVGAVVGAFAISIGVGGSILLVPLLVGFLHVPLKKAVSAGLFFVVFSSLSGLISLSIGYEIDYESGIIIGLASLVGVAAGIALQHRTKDELQKKLLILFYISIAAYLLYRVTLNG